MNSKLSPTYLVPKPSLSSGKRETSARENAQIVEELRQHYPISLILDAAGMARSTFYYQRQQSLADDKYAMLKQRIRTIYDKHRGRYGYRRVMEAIRQLGESINYKTVQRLMKLLRLKSLVRSKKYRSYQGE